MTRLVVAPHADDEVMGCGGLIAKYPSTLVVVAARPSEERWAEHRKAMEILGGRSVGHLMLPDGRVGDEPQVLVSLLDGVFADYQPGEVYLPYPGAHQDHVAVFEAGMRACRQSLSAGHWMPPSVLVYETPTYDLDLTERGLRYSVFESLTEEQVEAKRLAMQAYDSQCQKPHAGSPEELVARARSIGLARNVDAAEQFAAVRVVR